MPTPLEAVLLQRIARDGPIPFRDFMEAALFHPEHGYYASGPDIGAGGDFYTAASFPAFARALARQAKDAWERLGRPDDFRVVEVGGGTGALADGMRAALDAPATFVLVERSARLAAAQRARGFDVVPSLDDLPPAPTLLVANEVFDALPVHRIVGTKDGPREAHVAAEGGRLVEALLPIASPEVARAVAAAPPEPGRVLELRPDARRLLAGIARALDPGFGILIDYGAEGGDPRGTLATYADHRAGDDPLARPGEVDLTADVDFAALRRDAETAGLAVAGPVPQGRFLAALGVLDEAVRSGEAADLLAAKSLVVPGGMGERFRVLVVSRGVAPDLAGLRAVW